MRRAVFIFGLKAETKVIAPGESTWQAKHGRHDMPSMGRAGGYDDPDHDLSPLSGCNAVTSAIDFVTVTVR